VPEAGSKKTQVRVALIRASALKIHRLFSHKMGAEGTIMREGDGVKKKNIPNTGHFDDHGRGGNLKEGNLAFGPDQNRMILIDSDWTGHLNPKTRVLPHKLNPHRIESSKKTKRKKQPYKWGCTNSQWVETNRSSVKRCWGTSINGEGASQFH